jgi:hypothetical protein
VRGPSHRAKAHGNAPRIQFGLKLAQAHMAFRRNPLPEPVLIGLQHWAAMTAHLAGRNIPVWRGFAARRTAVARPIESVSAVLPEPCFKQKPAGQRQGNSICSSMPASSRLAC